MRLIPAKTNITEIEADALILGLYEGTPLSAHAAVFDQATDGLLSRLIEAQEITRDRYELTSLLAVGGVRAQHVLLVGLGPREGVDQGVAFRAAATAARQLAGKERHRLAVFLEDQWSAELIQAAIAGVLTGCQGQDLYRAKKKRHAFGEVIFSGAESKNLGTGEVLGQAVNLARQLVNEPPSEIYPESFVERAEQVAVDCGLEIEVWDEHRLADERCGALLAVARGSTRPPRLLILRHQGGRADTKPVALVGKGVTFDSGGLSLKPSDGMLTMKCDMAGAATVLAAMQAIARLELPVHVVGLMGLVENMVAGDSYKLGDVLTARNGKTIEVHNTDAEGRLVLADTLNVAVEQGSGQIIDLATLTGACVVALGNDVVGVMANDQGWCDEVLRAAQVCGEPAWQLPMFPEFGEQIKSGVADIKNVGEGRWGGAITAAKFLEEFVDDVPWVHLDIAGPSFLDKRKPWSDGGGTGVMVRTLVEVIRAIQ